MELRNVQGLDKLAAALRELPKNVARKQLRKPVAKAGRLIRDDAIRRAPVDTGRLEQAVLLKYVAAGALTAQYIVAVRHGKSGRVKRKGTIVNLDAWYWTFLEFGTAKMPAQRFMRPAFESNKERALTTITEGIRAGVEAEAAALGGKG